ncbi:FAD-dependent monooxygenase [Streptomyces sp. NPDC048331]|uniref:FAD-dependent monooxygenase n=1 Tax=Streptomyces sp. NPDC048331 TaxID=3365534 RepID=UPI0037208779
MGEKTTALVVGAGPTGLATACALRASGIAVRVIDGAPGPSRTSRALGLQPRGIEVLERLGALGDLPRRAVAIGQVVTYVEGKPAARLQVGRRTKLVTRPGLIISQAEVEAGLRRRLGALGTEVEWRREVTSVVQDGDGVRVGFSDGGSEHADWLVGCDGAHSGVRKAAGIDFPGVPVIERFLLADVRAPLPLPRGAVCVWLHGDRMLGAFPLPGEDVWRLMAPAPSDHPGDLGPAEVRALLAEALEARSGIPAAAVGEGLWTSTFRIHRRLASTYRQGRVLLAGDAAHIHSPFGGQGMNTGLGDAENLAWKLALVADGRAAEPLLDTYEAERRPIAEEVLASTSAMTRLVVGDTRLARALRNHVFVPLMNRPFAQRALWEKSSQLKVTYRGGPLAGRSLPGRGPHVGDRVPDLDCLRTDGRGTRLHSALGAAWAVLTSHHDVPGHAAVVRRRLGETAVVSLTARDLPSPAMLVRPDGHLAWQGNSPADLDRALTRILERGGVR